MLKVIIDKDYVLSNYTPSYFLQNKWNIFAELSQKISSLLNCECTVCCYDEALNLEN
jgi:hypothetical protein